MVHIGHVYQIVSTKNSKYLFSSDFEGYLKQFDVETMEMCKDYGKIHEGHITAVVASPNSQFLVRK